MKKRSARLAYLRNDLRTDKDSYPRPKLRPNNCCRFSLKLPFASSNNHGVQFKQKKLGHVTQICKGSQYVLSSVLTKVICAVLYV